MRNNPPSGSAVAIASFFKLAMLLSLLAFPLVVQSAYIFVPDSQIGLKTRFYDINGIRVQIFTTPALLASGGFSIDPILGTATPFDLLPPGQLPPLPPSLLAQFAPQIPLINALPLSPYQSVLPQNWFQLFDPLVAAKLFSFAFFLVALSGAAGHGVGILISMFNR